MKKLAFLLLTGFSFASAHAQFAFGIKGGVNISNVNGINVSGTNSLIGYNAGVFLALPVTHHLALQPELVYSDQGFKGAFYDLQETAHMNYINIPVLLKYHFLGIFIETGPQIGFLATAKSTQQGGSIDDKGYYNSPDFSWVFGAGVKIPTTPILIDARYNFGLSNIVNNARTGDIGAVHNGCFQIGVMIRLFSAPGSTSF